MKIDLGKHKYHQKPPKVLLFGNGIARCYDSISVSNLLKALRSNDCELDVKELEKIPLSMAVVIASNDNIDATTHKIRKNMTDSKNYACKGDLALFKMLLSLDFDAYLTTNYSYEMEYAADDKFFTHIRKYAAHSTGCQKREAQYQLHSFYRMNYNGKNKNMWHIHGEAKNKSSVILGHWSYGSLIFKYKQEFERTQYRNFNHSDELSLTSWLDYFVFGDVYIIGLGMNLSETDLWWLLNRKKRETQLPHGRTIYINVGNELQPEIRGMLKAMDVEIRDYIVKENNYLQMYEKAIGDLEI